MHLTQVAEIGNTFRRQEQDVFCLWRIKRWVRPAKDGDAHDPDYLLADAFGQQAFCAQTDYPSRIATPTERGRDRGKEGDLSLQRGGHLRRARPLLVKVQPLTPRRSPTWKTRLLLNLQRKAMLPRLSQPAPSILRTHRLAVPPRWCFSAIRASVGAPSVLSG